MVVAVYTGMGLYDQMVACAAQVLPGARLASIVDDTIIFDINRDGALRPATVRRILRYYSNAADSGADVIFNTCSSIGELVAMGQRLVDVPIVRIDEPMAEEAVARFERIGILATLPSTLAPTQRLISQKAARAGQHVAVVTQVAEGAYQALAAGEAAAHDRLVAKAVERLSHDVDGIVLAQASMARMQNTLAESTGVPVLTSLRSGLEAVKAALSRSPAAGNWGKG